MRGDNAGPRRILPEDALPSAPRTGPATGPQLRAPAGPAPDPPSPRVPRRALWSAAALLSSGAATALGLGDGGGAAAGAVAGLVGLVFATAAVLFGRLVVVTVRGPSMEPTYCDGDRVLVRRHRGPAPGRVIVVDRAWRPAAPAPGHRWMIKRVAAVPGDPVPRETVPALEDVPENRVPPGRLVLLGDNAAVSFDSRQAGYFSADRVMGTVIRSLPRPAANDRAKTGVSGRVCGDE